MKKLSKLEFDFHGPIQSITAITKDGKKLADLKSDKEFDDCDFIVRIVSYDLKGRRWTRFLSKK